MATVLVQFRADEAEKAEALRICEKLGLSLASYLRLCMSRLILEKGVPFSMKLPSEADNPGTAALREDSRIETEAGAADMTSDETVQNNEHVSDSEPEASLRAVYANKQVGERFDFGGYPQGSDYDEETPIAFRSQMPITWRVLRRDSDSLLVISEYALDVKKYNEDLEYKDNLTWSECSLRRWLNGEFMNNAFTDDERALIMLTKLNNNAGPSTEDKVFLLSIEEAESLFSDDRDREAKPTLYVFSKDFYTQDGNVSWWLRSHDNGCEAAEVWLYGDITSNMDDNYSGVRPALRLAL